MEAELPQDVPHQFISAVTGFGLTELKDKLWSAITDERNQISTADIIHRPLDKHHRVREEDEFIFEQAPLLPSDDEDYDEDFDDDDYEEIDEFDYPTDDIKL